MENNCTNVQILRCDTKALSPGDYLIIYNVHSCRPDLIPSIFPPSIQIATAYGLNLPQMPQEKPIHIWVDKGVRNFSIIVASAIVSSSLNRYEGNRPSD